MITTIKEWKEKINESVRRGHFPYFSIDLERLTIKFDFCDNELAVDAITYNQDDESLSWCSEDWSQRECEQVGNDMLERLKNGESKEDLLSELEENYF